MLSSIHKWNGRTRITKEHEKKREITAWIENIGKKRKITRRHEKFFFFVCVSYIWIRIECVGYEQTFCQVNTIFCIYLSNKSIRSNLTALSWWITKSKLNEISRTLSFKSENAIAIWVAIISNILGECAAVEHIRCDYLFFRFQWHVKKGFLVYSVLIQLNKLSLAIVPSCYAYG